MFLSECKGMKMYALHLQMKERAEGHNPGALGIDGWKQPSKKSLIELYRNGKLKYSHVSAVHDRLKAADHREALKYGNVTEEELEAAGVFVHHKQKKAKPKNPASQVKRDWRKTTEEIEKIMLEWKARQLAKEIAESKAKRGFEVKPTEKEAAAMLERHQNKGKCYIK